MSIYYCENVFKVHTKCTIVYLFSILTVLELLLGQMYSTKSQKYDWLDSQMVFSFLRITSYLEGTSTLWNVWDSRGVESSSKTSSGPSSSPRYQESLLVCVSSVNSILISVLILNFKFDWLLTYIDPNFHYLYHSINR